MAKRLALLVGNSIFEDKEHFPDLHTPANNVEDVARLLRQHGGFEIIAELLDADAATVRDKLDELFCSVEKGDLVLFYYCGHGYKTPKGSFFLAASNSKPHRIAATCIRPADIRDPAHESNASHRVMVLDCCFSGQLAEDGTMGADEPISWEELRGEAIAVLASSGKAQKSFEEKDRISEEKDRNSLFTRFLIQGIETGEADRDKDGKIKISEWFDYAEQHVIEERPEQTPVKSLRERQGDIIIARNPIPPEKPLPAELQQAVESNQVFHRVGAVVGLESLATGGDPALAATARKYLKKLANDDSKTVSQAANAALARLPGGLKQEKATHEEKPKAAPAARKPDTPRQSDHDEARRNYCLTTLQKETRSVNERVEAGNELAVLGDPRFDPAAWYLPKEDLLGFVEIPAGKFWMGEESSRHEVKLPAYSMARYPVTVAQYEAFVKDAQHKMVDADCLKGTANHPVVNITWYEALKYCEWLTEKLKSWQGTPRPLVEKLTQGWQVMLPSEAEWEKAARGTDGRIYPWGDEFDTNLANTEETGIKGTSAVGCFPGGASPYGMLDMSGNVWEWTRSLWGKDLSNPDFEYPYDPADKKRENIAAGKEFYRIIRGGSFDDALRYVRCACRSRNLPYLRLRYFGFRLVLSPLK